MANEWRRATLTLDPPGQSHTINNLMNAIDSFLVQTGWVEPSWSTDPDDRYFIRSDVASRERWQFTGDGPTQACGIRVSKEQTNTEVWLTVFIENQAGTGSQVGTRGFSATTGSNNQNSQPQVIIKFDTTVPNNYLFVGGEDGFYVESGRDGQNNNLAHGAVTCFASIPELNATKDVFVKHTSQGLIMDLFGDVSGTVTRAGCRFTEARDNRIVTNDGTNRNFTAYMYLRTSRGLVDITTPGTQADDRGYYIGARDSIFGATMGFEGLNGGCEKRWGCTFGLLNTPEDERFRMSPILMFQETTRFNFHVTSTSSSNTLSATGGQNTWMDIRHLRQILRWVAIDYTLIPWINVSDAATGKVYRVVEFNDAGRVAKLGIEWPSSSLTVSIA